MRQRTLFDRVASTISISGVCGSRPENADPLCAIGHPPQPPPVTPQPHHSHTAATSDRIRNQGIEFLQRRVRVEGAFDATRGAPAPPVTAFATALESPFSPPANQSTSLPGPLCQFVVHWVVGRAGNSCAGSHGRPSTSKSWKGGWGERYQGGHSMRLVLRESWCSSRTPVACLDLCDGVECVCSVLDEKQALRRRRVLCIKFVCTLTAYPNSASHGPAPHNHHPTLHNHQPLHQPTRAYTRQPPACITQPPAHTTAVFWGFGWWTQ